MYTHVCMYMYTCMYMYAHLFMFLCMDMYMYMYTCMYMCLCACACVRVCARMCACVRAYVCVCVQVLVCACLFVPVRSLSLSLCASLRVRVCVCVFPCAREVLRCVHCRSPSCIQVCQAICVASGLMFGHELSPSSPVAGLCFTRAKASWAARPLTSWASTQQLQSAQFWAATCTLPAQKKNP